MKKLLCGIGAALLFAAAGFVSAQTATPRAPTVPQAPASTPSGRPLPEASANAEHSAASAAQPDRGTQMRLATIDTSAAAFRKLDQDNDGRISALEAAENPRVAAAFTMADKDKDGYLSQEEFEALKPGVHPEPDASSPNGDRPATPPTDH